MLDREHFKLNRWQNVADKLEQKESRFWVWKTIHLLLMP